MIKNGSLTRMLTKERCTQPTLRQERRDDAYVQHAGCKESSAVNWPVYH